MRLAPLLRSIAYEAALFERSIALLVPLAVAETPEERKAGVTDLLASMFTIRFSGTHALVEQRRVVIEKLIRSDEPVLQELGAKALEQALRTRHFSSHRSFEFGARSRDFGSCPATIGEFQHWISSFLALIAEVGASNLPAAPRVRAVFGSRLSALWQHPSIRDNLETAARRIAAVTYWDEGWIGCHRALWLHRKRRTGAGEAALDGPDPDQAQLEALERELAPKELPDRIKAFVLSTHWWPTEADGVGGSISAAAQSVEEVAEHLGRELASSDLDHEPCLFGIFRASNGRCWPFARGFASGVRDPDATWASLVSLFGQVGSTDNGMQMLGGYLTAMAERCPARVATWLDTAIADPVLAPWFPILQTQVGLDEAGRARLLGSLEVGSAPAGSYGWLAFGGSARTFTAAELGEVTAKVAEMPGGFAVAAKILAMRLWRANGGAGELDPAIAAVGRELLNRFTPERSDQMLDHDLAILASTCLVGEEGKAVVVRVASRLLEVSSTDLDALYLYSEFMRTLFKMQPAASLDAFLGPRGSVLQHHRMECLGSDWDDLGGSPVDTVPPNALLDWCARTPGTNHELAASCISYARIATDGDGLAWTDTALAVLDQAPDKVAVLRRFIARFRPTSGWSGSLAEIIATRAFLLRAIEAGGERDLAAFARQERERLLQEAEEARGWEADNFRMRSERFE